MKKYWNKIVSFEWKGNASLRVKAVKALAGFLVMMIVFTILSRTADSMTVARVKTGVSEKQTLDREISADGTFLENRQIMAGAPAGLKISHVNVGDGDYVEEGDILLEVDMEDLNEKIEDAEREINSAASQIETNNYNDSLTKSEKSKEISRSQEDYNKAKRDADKEVSRAKTKLDDAERELSDFKARKSELLAAPATGNPDDEDYVEPVGMTEEAYNEQLKLLESDYKTAQQDYEDAQTARTDNLQTAQRTLDDARTETQKDDESTLDATKAEKEKKEKELEKLRAMKEAEGKVRAPQEGFVTKVNAVLGAETTDTDILMADTSEGFKFEAGIDKDQRKYLNTGDDVTLYVGNELEIRDLKVGSIIESEEEPGVYTVSVTVKVTNGDIKIGGTARMHVELSSKSYSTCVPNSVVKGDASNSFVYIVTEREGIIGTQTYVEKLPVKILEKNDSYTAVETYGSLEYVLNSNKDIEEGDRVRIDNDSVEE